MYVDSFGIEYIPQEVFYKNKGKCIIHNIIRIQSDDSFMCGFYCIILIEYESSVMKAGRAFLRYSNLISPNGY